MSNTSIREFHPGQFTQEEVELRRVYRNRRKLHILKQLKNMFEYVMVMALALLTSYLVSIIITPVQGLLSVLYSWILFYISRIVRLSYQLRDFMEKDKKKHVISAIAKNSCIIVSYTLIILYYAFRNFVIMYTILIFQVISLLLPIIFYTQPTNSCFCMTKWLKFVGSLIRTSVIILLIMIYGGVYKATTNIAYM
jgi:hypothetical protein